MQMSRTSPLDPFADQGADTLAMYENSQEGLLEVPVAAAEVQAGLD